MAQWWTGAPPPRQEAYTAGSSGPVPRVALYPWIWPSRCLALFAFHDSPPAPSSLPLPLGLGGFRKGFLSLGASSRLCPQVVLAAVGPPVLGGAEGWPVLVFLAKRIGAKVAKQSGRFATHVTMMPRTFPLPEGPLAQAQARQVVGLGTGLAVTQHQLAAIPTAETLVFGLLLPFTSGSPPPGSFLGLFALFLRRKGC